MNLTRALLFAFDREGNRIQPLSRFFLGVRCKETPPHALSRPVDADEREEVMQAFDRLTDLEHHVMALLDMEVPHRRWCALLKSQECDCNTWPHTAFCPSKPCDCGAETLSHRTIAAGDLLRFERLGYMLAPGTERDDERGVRVLDVVGIERTKLTQSEAGERVGLSPDQVYRVVRDAKRKLRGG
jgi:hypothetical protein